MYFPHYSPPGKFREDQTHGKQLQDYPRLTIGQYLQGKRSRSPPLSAPAVLCPILEPESAPKAQGQGFNGSKRLFNGFFSIRINKAAGGRRKQASG